MAVRDTPWLWEQSALEAHFPGVALGGTVCLCQLTDRHLGVKFLPLLPPSFQRLVSKLLSFTTNNLTPSPEASLQVLLLGSRTGQEPSLPFALCASREEGWVLCPPRTQKVQAAWVGREAVLDFSNNPFPGWRVQVATELSQLPQTTPSFLKLSQSVINYMIRIGNELQVSNSFVQGLTVCLWPLQCCSCSPLPQTRGLQAPTGIRVRQVLLRSVNLWSWCYNSLEVYCDLLCFLR